MRSGVRPRRSGSFCIQCQEGPHHAMPSAFLGALRRASRTGRLSDVVIGSTRQTATRIGWLAAALLLGYIALWVASPFVTSNSSSDLDVFFWPAAQGVIKGHPLLAYSLRGTDVYPNAAGPLGFLILTPLAALSGLLHLPDAPRVHLAVLGPIAAALAGC